MTQRSIKITRTDMKKLSSLIEAWRYHRGKDHGHLEALEEELDRAEVLEPDAAPSGVVAMNSWVTVTDMNTGQRHEYQIVFPRDANFTEGKISVLAPIGTALLGYSIGHEVEWNVPGGVRCLRIDDVSQEKAEPAHAA